MRLLGMILALAAIAWVFMQGSLGGSVGSGETGKSGERGGSNAGALPQGYQQPLEKARNLEQSVLESAEERLKAIDEQNQR